jgi:hypothetical protein
MARYAGESNRHPTDCSGGSRYAQGYRFVGFCDSLFLVGRRAGYELGSRTTGRKRSGVGLLWLTTRPSRSNSRTRLGQLWVSLMNLGGVEMSAIRVRSQSGRFPAKADTRWQASPAGSVANGPKRPSRSQSLDLNDHLDFNGIIERKPRHPYGRACMLSNRLAENIHHQIGKSVYHLWLVTKIVGRVDHP